MSARHFLLAVFSSALASLGLSGCGGDDAGGATLRGARSLVLVTLDTTNAGALDLYGKDRGITPRLAALGREAQVFDAARSVAPLTLPSHASMLTGLFPPRHGLRDNGLAALPDEAWTLAEAALDSGRRTAAFVSAAVVDRPFGLDQGFETFDGPARRQQAAGEYMLERSAGETIDRALAWLASRRSEEGFFLWVHLFDPHAPYEAPRPFLEKTGGNAYLAEVAVMDDAIGRLLDALPPAEECAVVVAADHGESLGRHGEPTHALLVHDATIHVPFLVRWPDGRAAAERSDAPVSVVDVFPTALGILGLDDPGGHDGHDLASLPAADRPVYFESYAGYVGFGLAPLAGVADGNGKWIGGEGGRFYAGGRVPADPPSVPGTPQTEADVSRYVAALEAVESGERLTPAAATESSDAMRALGYSGAGTLDQSFPSVLESTSRPSVADGLADALATYQAMTVAGVGKRHEAMGLMEDLLARNPGNLVAGQVLGAMLIEEGRVSEAVETLEGVLRRGAAGGEALQLMGLAYTRAGRMDDAVTVLERAALARPGDPEVERLLDQARAAAR